MLAMFFLLRRTQVMIFLLVSFGALYVFVCHYVHGLD